jgi:WD40 repeat protein/ABC-type transport system substrate-binding protein
MEKAPKEALDLDTTIYTVGGTVQAGSGLYIPRHSDNDLLTLCQEGAFAYVLAPRQLGKSSLMIRTAERLQEAGVLSVIIDLTQLGVQLSADAWYLGLLTVLEDSLMLDTDVVSWWQAHAHLGNAQRLILFLQNLVTTKLDQPLVIFVDEIDTTLSLDFTDDFYAAIRSLYVARARVPELKRFSFVLIGVASPGDLIRDPKRTPFNIGQRVEMTDFKLEEALPLAKGLGAKPGEEKEALGWVFKWTGGHPYLTQRLCRVIAEYGQVSGVVKTELSEERIDHVVSETFFGEKSFQDNNLQFVRDMLTRRTVDLEEVLSTYRQIRAGKQKIGDDEQSLIKSHLKLSGIVKVQGAALRVRNEVYHTVFDEKWIKEHLPVNWAKRLRQAMGLIAASFIITLVMAGLAVFALLQQGLANDRAVEANSARSTAEVRLAQVESAQGTAEARRLEAEKAQAETERQSKISKAQALAANAVTQLGIDPERSILLAVEAVKLAQQPGIDPVLPQASDALRRALETARLNRPPLTAHLGVVNSAAFSPDGQYFVTSSNDDTAIIWEAATGKVLQILKGHTDWVTRATFSPDGQFVLTVSNDSTVRVWGVQNGKELVRISGQPPGKDISNVPAFNSAAFSSDERYILTAGQDNVARLWNFSGASIQAKPSSIIAGQELASLQGHTSPVNLALFSPDSHFALTTSNDGTARLWEIPSGRLVHILTGHSLTVNAAAFSPDGRFIVTAGQDNTAILYETLTGKILTTLTGHTGWVSSATFSPDGRYILTASLDNTGKVWEVNPSDSTVKEVATLKGHSAMIIQATFSPDGRYIVTASADHSARVWETETGKELYVFNGHAGNVTSAVFSPDGRLIVTTSDDGTARVWEALPGKDLAIFKGHHDLLNSAAFSPDGRYIVTTSNDNTARVWEIQSRKVVANLQGHTDWVTSAVFSPDGKYVVTASRDNTARVWEVSSGKEVISLQGHVSPVSGAAFSPDGRFIVTASLDQTARLWDAVTGKQITVYKGHTSDLTGATFSPDGRFIVTSSLDGTARVWEVATGQELVVLMGHTGAVNRAVFSADSRFIVTAGRDGTARVWELSQKNSGQPLTATEIVDFKGHSDGVNSAAFSPDGLDVVTAGVDGTVRVWDIKTGKEITTLTGHTGPVTSATFSPDGNYIVTSGWDRTAQVHIFAPGELLTVAQARLTRVLTPEERVQFGLDSPSPSTTNTTNTTLPITTSAPTNGAAIQTPAIPSPTQPAALFSPSVTPGATVAATATVPVPSNVKPAGTEPGIDLVENVKFDSTGGKKGGQLTYTFAGTFPISLQPYYGVEQVDETTCNIIYANLIGQSNNAKYYPYLLAEVPTLENGDVRVAADGNSMELTLKLKPGLMWSDGSPLTSKDLAYTVRWVTDQDNTGITQDLAAWNMIEGVDTPDNTTAVLKFKQIYGPYLSFLNLFYPLPEKVWSQIPLKNQGAEKSEEAKRPRLSSGPMKVAENVDYTHLVLVRNDYFRPVWGFNAYLDKVIFQSTADPSEALTSLSKGTVDEAENLDDSQGEAASKVPDSRVELAQQFSWEYLQMNLTNPLFQDKAVRQALNLALDKPALIKQFRTSKTVQLAVNVSPLSPFVDQTLKPSQYDPEGAKTLLEAAGWKAGPDGIRVKEGRRLSFTLSSTDVPVRVKTAQVMLAYWKAIGAEVNFVAYHSSDFFGPWNKDGILSRGNYDVAMFAQSVGIDPDFSYSNYHSSQIPSETNQGGGNYGRIIDPNIDRTLDEQRATADQAKRKAALQTFQRTLYENTYEIPLYSRVNNIVIHNRVKNFKPNPTSEGNFWNVVEMYVD